ncbi:NUMOD4 domain-containing protein [Lactococcus taiwanensis]|uniref:NUMOD4 domain-containing protein n=1 Tax=Lactococcus taiwanensis TaxID=1151742 RepID=UPI00289AAA0B|nr:NUMOD4 domain-containing protein [Lactococcus taiwanensis]
MSEEIWRPILDYENYVVSNLGNVKNIKSNKLLSPGLDKDGYKLVVLYKNNKPSTRRVHRLVAQTFIPNHANKPQVNHKNEVRTDNRVENLEWMTSEENANYGSRNLNISKSLKGNKNCLGRKLSNETKLKLSIISKRRYASKALGVDLVKVVEG